MMTGEPETLGFGGLQRIFCGGQDFQLGEVGSIACGISCKNCQLLDCGVRADVEIREGE
jgi:hypothetical protein